MKKRTWLISLFVASVIIMLGLAITHLCKHPPLFYYTQLTISPSLHELPTRLIRRAFRIVADKELPSKADGLRAIFSGGRERAIFVRFQTDPEGIEYILETFGGSGVKLKMYEEEFLKMLTASNVSLLHHASRWQEELGVCLYSQDSIESGRLLEDIGDPSGRPGYRVFIDDQRSTVYIEAWSF